MNIQQMQQQLITRISTVNDEDILRMLSEELSFSLQSHTDLAAILTDDDLRELTMLVNEPLDKDTMSLSEFNNIMEQWRMK
jgi:hypothetical protein